MTDEGKEVTTEKAGARNSRMDQSSLDTAHDALVAAGAHCPGVDGEAPKSYRAITDAPNLRGDNWQSCVNCNMFKWMPSEEVHVYGEMGSAEGYTEGKGICKKHEFMTQQNYVCDDWQEVPPPEPMMNTEMALSNVIKAISKTDEELRVGNYIFLHGGRDLTGIVYGKNADGSSGEYFSERTDPESEYTKSGVLHVDFEHGYDPDNIGNDENNVLGYVDWKTAKRDKTGLYVERVLNRRSEYMQWLEQLIEEGLIGNSSEAVPALVEKSASGEILRWGLKRDTLTVTPMEPRMLSQNAMTAIKHLSEIAPQLKSLLNITGDEPSPKAEVISDGEEQEPVLETSNELVEKAGQPLPAKEIEMADNEQGGEKTVQIDYDLLAEKVAAKLDPVMPSKAVPAVIHADNLGDPEPAKVLSDWLLGGSTRGIKSIGARVIVEKGEQKIHFDGHYGKAALQEDTAGEGGNLVPNDFYAGIIAKRDQMSIPRKAGAQVFRTSRDYLDIPFEDTSMTNFVKTAEEAAYNENEPTFGNAQAHVYKYTKVLKISEELIEDQDANLDAFLTEALGRAWGLTENELTLTGSGSSTVQGVYVGGSVGYTFADTNGITAAEIANLFWSLGDPYHEGATWNMKGATMGYLQGLTGNPFSFVTTPVADTFKNMFYGNKPYFLSDSAAAIAAGAKTVMIGNWAFYALVERRGLTLSRNPYLYQANGQIGLFASVRMGGVVLQSEAFKWGIQTA